MDRLTNEERALAWKSNWHPSFAGIAIVNRDFTFRSVNPQFCKLLGVTPADLIGERFQDITPPGLKQLDERNAKMVVDGLIDFYLLPKKYEFHNGKEVDVILLVTRAPLSHEGDFQFFVSRIMLDEKGALLSAHDAEISGSGLSSPTLTEKVAGFAVTYWAWIATAAAAVTGVAWKVIDLIYEGRF